MKRIIAIILLMLCFTGCSTAKAEEPEAIVGQWRLTWQLHENQYKYYIMEPDGNMIHFTAVTDPEGVTHYEGVLSTDDEGYYKEYEFWVKDGENYFAHLLQDDSSVRKIEISVNGDKMILYDNEYVRVPSNEEIPKSEIVITDYKSGSKFTLDKLPIRKD